MRCGQGIGLTSASPVDRHPSEITMNSPTDMPVPETDPLTIHLLTKWKRFFRFFDMDNDGLWTRRDMRTLADRFVREAGNMLSESGATHVRKQAEHWLATQEEELCQVAKGEISLDVLVTTLRRVVNSNRDTSHLLKELDIFSEIFFEIIDINRDGKISMPELSVFYRAVGIHNQNVLHTLFSCLDLMSDRSVSREEFRIAYREYFFGDQRDRNQVIPFLFDKEGLFKKQRELFYLDY